MSFQPRVPIPEKGASLMLAFRANSKNILVIGDDVITASRVLSCLEADATVYLVADPTSLCPELKYRLEHQQIKWLSSDFQPSLLDTTALSFDLAFICINNHKIDLSEFKRHRIPINVADHPEDSDFFMTSTYRDRALQVAVSTNGQASKLATRIRRELTTHLPPHLGDAIERVGILRKRLRQLDPSFNSLRRMSWLAQICEYWSIDRLAKLSDHDMDELLDMYDEGYESVSNETEFGSVETTTTTTTMTKNNSSNRMGSISLVGAGTGDPDLLTLAALKAIKEADLILADKIVPASILNLIPTSTTVKIARKFPGNADAAQHEFNLLALRAVQEGKRVVRLKQGDPFLFGRGGEEVLFFKKYNIVPHLIPGLSSTVAASLAVGIPLTHRSVSSQFLVTTGTGASNSRAPLPTFDRHRTDVFLMSIHRLRDLTRDLMESQGYPRDLPSAVVERASCSDQRVIWAPLNEIVDLLESVGTRPPGLFIVGYAVNVLKHENKGDKGIAAHLMTESGLLPSKLNPSKPVKVVEEDKRSPIQNINLLTLHDPEQAY
ncbi:tetrapyrrole methylase [Cokeromyces recurvatus]|uniref:tetrapyrrole methylase n=1 Tax=Cokeromyces recurvatus TaxID=90255 RepID=UPI00221F5B75|nr:tetrapyrrole methylase [Cokeromyces recurvatus]KAI7900576.1 tetrapyrrole methylase [Cokeromyces recurvatus]